MKRNNRSTTTEPAKQYSNTPLMKTKAPLVSFYPKTTRARQEHAIPTTDQGLSREEMNWETRSTLLFEKGRLQILQGKARIAFF